jgi:tetratricopeptide (TPR) repeat protein
MRVENQTLVLRVMAAVLPIASALFMVSPAAADERETCTAIPAKSTIDFAVAACGRAIASGQYTAQNLATLHTSRAIAYAAKRQYDRASQDFDQATRLDPQFAQG